MHVRLTRAGALALVVVAVGLGWSSGRGGWAPQTSDTAPHPGHPGRPGDDLAPTTAAPPLDDEVDLVDDDEARPDAAEVADPRTTIAVLRVREGGEAIDLVRWVTRPFATEAPGPRGATHYVLEDAVTGERLAAGPCPLPRLCTCPGPDHPRGCLRVRHQAVVRLKLPRLAPVERLTIVGPDGPIASFILDEAS
ncbi:MAG: hypothetical protein M9894_35345 [Planctomycetes bacterium]|nr:hypothetical protein [Planctomycetota bacterium]